MADEPDLLDTLFDEPFQFEFFQAVRLLERAHPNLRPVGHATDPSTEVVRFHTHNSLAFPASEIVELKPPAGEERSGPAQMWVNFMGLTGSQGPLPLHYTALLSDPSQREETAALAAFFDIFNHRFISLFYRAWEKSRFPIAYERGGTDRFSACLLSLVGLGHTRLQRRLAVNDHALLYYSGLLSQRPRSASALESLLQDYFAVPVQVQQFVGEWFLLNPDTLTALGEANHQLGVTTSLWERVFDPPARFRVEIGPLGYETFREFLPDGLRFRRLVDLTRFFVGDELGFEVRPVLERRDVPPCTLDGEPSQRLGWSMWLPPSDADDEIVQPLFEARVAETLVQEAVTL